jgi:hypothetical protein
MCMGNNACNVIYLQFVFEGLKTANILLENNMNGKLDDFGLSKG